jgi:uncharacterized protein YdaU (DUF1376 family)
MSSKPPAFQFYAKDFLVGTMEMSLLEIGAYAKLLAWSWDNGPVPADERKRAMILGITERSLRSLWDGIANKWASTPAGYVNERLERQRTLLAEFTERQSQRGSAGAAERWRKHGSSMAQAVTQAQPDDGSAVCSLQSPRDQDPDPTPRAERATYPADFDNFWRAYPNKTGKGAALKAWQRERPSTDVLARMFKALSWQVNQPAWRRDGGQYVPHPATWLNRRGWEDEPFHPIGPEPERKALGSRTGDSMEAAKASLESRLRKLQDDDDETLTLAR